MSTSTEPEETAAPAAPVAAPAKRVLAPKLTANEWAKIEALWEQGDTTFGDLVKMYGRSVSTFMRHFRARKIVKGSARAKMRERVNQAMEREAMSEAQVLAARIKETKEEHYKMATALGRLTWNELLQAKKDKNPVSVAMSNLKALHAASLNLKIVREERFAVLGLDRADSIDLDVIPELIISELTAEQVAALRARDHTDVDDAETVQKPSEGDSEDDDDAIIDDAL